MSRTITLALTGASGMPFGLRLLDCLLRAGAQVHLLYSPAAQVVAKQECDLTLPTQPREAMRLLGERYGARAGQLNVYAREDWYAPVASGSNPGDAMAVCPCSMGTLGAIAGGLADNLIERAADVMLKGAPAAGARAARDAAVRDPPREHAEARARRRGDPAAGAWLLHAPAVGRRHRRLHRRAGARSPGRRPRARAAVGRGSPRRAAARRHRLTAASMPSFARPPSDRQPFSVPLFPLRTVLFPGGVLPLKIFEQRYIDMAKDCLRDERPFGVCLITRGEEVATPETAPPEFAPIGTLATIASWEMPQLGILHVATEGGLRFQVQKYSIEPSGLVVGTVTTLRRRPPCRCPKSTRRW
jgi:polyprenyl P-hydroxybenzoate/phenylacrylic acid decarboxylase-like protein